MELETSKCSRIKEQVVGARLAAPTAAVQVMKANLVFQANLQARCRAWFEPSVACRPVKQVQH